MKIALLFCVIVLCGVSARPTVFVGGDNEHRPAVTRELVEKINGAQSLWTADHNNKFASWSIAEAKKLMGVLPKTEKSMTLPTKTYKSASKTAIPTNFDGRTAFSQCSSFNDIRDQASCGSCWAFGAAEAMTDRWCVANNGTSNPRLSSEEIVSCCGGFKCFGCQGCNGGQLAPAWNFAHKYGLVSGGLYGDNSTCQPYLIPPCEHHVNGTRPPCQEGGGTPKCQSTCFGNGANFNADRHFFQAAYKLASISDIQTDIMTYGSVEAAFTVYEDFLSYKSGVYVHTTGSVLGGHAIKILGWGVENGTPYWLVANSWNYDWGNGGFFKIRRGTDECGIEDDVTAGIPKSQ